MTDTQKKSLAGSPLPADLKAALVALDHAAELVINRAHPGMRPRLNAMLQRIFDNAREPEEAEIHYWETALAFLVMEEEAQIGDAFAAAAARLQPLLHAASRPL